MIKPKIGDYVLILPEKMNDRRKRLWNSGFRTDGKGIQRIESVGLEGRHFYVGEWSFCVHDKEFIHSKEIPAMAILFD